MTDQALLPALIRDSHHLPCPFHAQIRCHLEAIKLARLPLTSGNAMEEACLREVLLGAYRLLAALCANGFRPTQVALLPELDHIVKTIEYKLVAADITPTDCLIEILKGNPQGT